MGRQYKQRTKSVEQKRLGKKYKYQISNAATAREALHAKRRDSSADAPPAGVPLLADAPTQPATPDHALPTQLFLQLAFLKLMMHIYLDQIQVYT